MHAIHRRATSILIGGVIAGAVFVSTASGQARPAAEPSEANFFVGTPAGWVHRAHFQY